MTKANESKPVVPGQEICIFTYGNDYNDSMSSLESFMSFMDDSEEDHAPIPATPTKKRSKPRRTGRPLVHQRTAAPNSPPTRSNSNPECATRPSSSPSRWGNKSCKSSPGVPRSTRRLSPTRPRPTLKTNNNTNADLNASAHSAHSLELKMLARQGSDRWGTSALHLSSSFGGHSHETTTTRWQDSKGDLKSESGHESTCLSRWSTSMSSSQMEQISTRPRFPRRMRSVGNANPTTTAPAGEKAWNNSFVQNTATTHTSTAVDSTGDDTYSTNKATTGSDVEELSMGWEEQSNRIVVDCSILLAEPKNQQPAATTAPRPSSPPQSIAPTNTPMPPPKPAATNKPRPRLPNRQKSFVRNTLSMGMAAKVVLERRDRFVKQRSEPSMVKNVDQSPTTVDRIPSDASLFSHSSQGTKSTSTTTAAEDTTHKRNLFRRQQSVPQSLLLSSSNGSSSDATTKKGNPVVQTGPLAALRKQRSLSCLAISKADIPQLPQRQDSQTSHSTTGSKCVFRKQRSLSCIRVVGEKDDTACACSSSKQRSQYHGPQLPKRMPSESSTRSRAWPTNQEEEEDHENDGKEEERKDFADDTTRIDPAPLPPRRQTSMGSLAAATAIVVEQNRAPTLALQEIHENQLGNRRLSLTKQRSAPSALSLRKLLMLDPGSIGAGAADPPPAKGVDKCQRLLDLTGFPSKLSDVDLDSTLFTACTSLLPDSSERSNWTDPNGATTNGRPRSLPELSSGSPFLIAQT